MVAGSIQIKKGDFLAEDLSGFDYIWYFWNSMFEDFQNRLLLRFNQLGRQSRVIVHWPSSAQTRSAFTVFAPDLYLVDRIFSLLRLSEIASIYQRRPLLP